LKKLDARIKDIIKIAISLAVLFLFRRLNLGSIIVVIYLLLFTYIIFKQIHTFRSTVRRILIDAVLNENHWLYKTLDRGRILALIGVIVSLLLSFYVISYVYIASYTVCVMLIMDIFIFLYINTHMKINFRKIFKENIANLFNTFLPVAINIIILTILVPIVEYVDKSNIYPIYDVPQCVIDTVSHPCILFQHWLRTMYYIELSVKSLRGIEVIGNWLYVVVYIALFSSVPFTGISLIYKWSAERNLK
jgi:hypothetical protein